MLVSFQKALEILKHNLCVENSLHSTSSNISVKKKLQHITSLKIDDKKIDQVLKLICSYAISAEKNCAYAGEAFLSQLVDIKSHSQEFMTKEDVLKFLQARLRKNNYELIKEALHLLSTDTKIFVKKSTSNKTFLELTEGFKFKVQPTISETYKVLINPSILCIDGYIESVSEVHYLFESLAETKKELVLCARGFANDVITTCSLNRNRGTLNVYLVIVPYDLENVNTLVDIATVTASDVVSSTKGDLIGKDNLKFSRVVEKIIFHQKEMIIKSSQSSQRQLNAILQKIEERKETESLIKHRLEALSSKQLTINIPDDLNFVSNSHELDLAIRLIIDTSMGKQPEDVAKLYLTSFQSYIKNLELVH